MCRQIKNGFTLAEVLVTLAIIGIVAALTIPNLITSIQENQYKSAWKKSYSTFSQAFMSYRDAAGGTIKGTRIMSDIDWITGELQRMLNVSKKCQYSAGCWHSNNQWYDFSGNSMNQTYTVAVILSDGILMSFSINNGNCADVSYGLVNGKGVCAMSWIDINGFKQPNTIGQDIYGIWIQDDRIAPFGTADDLYSNGTNCQKPNSGRGCSALYLTQ